MSVSAGSDIAALCSKCGDVWHVVVAMVDGRVAKVVCKECGGQHRYRTADGSHLKRPPTPRGPRAAKEPVERFESARVATDMSKPLRTYRASDSYEVGDRVEHPSFGQGVAESIDDGKVTVFFPGGRKVLVCGKGAAGAASSGLARPKPFDHSNPPAGGKPVTS